MPTQRPWRGRGGAGNWAADEEPVKKVEDLEAGKKDTGFEEDIELAEGLKRPEQAHLKPVGARK